MYDTVIEGRILQNGSPRDAFICISDQRIVKIKQISPGSGEIGELHRMGTSLVLPGAIDTHVHFRDPGMTAKEDFTTGSISAVFGGVTTIIDMPNTRPPTLDQVSLKAKEEIASRGSLIDYGLNLAVMNSSDILAVDLLLRGEGKVPPPAGLKAFLGESTGSLVLEPISSLSRWASVLERTEGVIALHAEDGSLFNKTNDPEKVKDVLMHHHQARPAISEAEAVRKALEALGPNSGRAHLLHISTGEGLNAAKGSSATIEVTPHHLLLDVKWGEKKLEYQAMGKVNPPLRTPDDRAALWKAISDGTITSMGSDHAPHLLDEKTRGLLSPSGMPGVETMVPLLLNEVGKRGLDIERLVSLISSGPAERYSMEGRGKIEEGFLADLMVVNMKTPRKIKGEDLHSKCGWTPYEGMIGVFPRKVYSRGGLILDEENLCAKPGRGVNIRA